MSTVRLILYTLLWLVIGIIIGYATYKIYRDYKDGKNEWREKK